MMFRAFAAIMLGLLWVAPASAASDAECREMSIDQDDGHAKLMMMCRGEDGAWVAAPNQPKGARSRAARTGNVTAESDDVPTAYARGPAPDRDGERGGATVAALSPAGAALTRRLDGYVATDARGWAFNHYDQGSMHDVRVTEGSAASGTMVLRGEYTFNGGSPGWVLAKLVGGKLECIQFWDAMVGCRTLRTPEDGERGRQAVGQMMAGMLDPSSGSGGSSQECDTTCQGGRFEMWRERHNQEDPAHPM